MTVDNVSRFAERCLARQMPEWPPCKREAYCTGAG